MIAYSFAKPFKSEIRLVLGHRLGVAGFARGFKSDHACAKGSSATNRNGRQRWYSQRQS